MKMRSVCLFASLMMTPALFAGPGALTVIHGIPSLRVSASVAGVGCAISDFNFGETAGPLPLPAGTYMVSLHPGTGCTAAAIPGFSMLPIHVGEDENVSLVAHLTSDGTPFLSRFGNAVSPVYAGRSRVILHHTAAAPDVDVKLERVNGTGAVVVDLANASTAMTPALLELKPGNYEASVYVAGTNTRAIGPASLALEANVTYLVYAIGTASGGPLQLKVIAVPGGR